MLTGQVPYDAATPPALLYQHVHEPVPSVRKLNSSLGSDCERIVKKAMAKETDKRFGTAGELAAAFKSIAAGRAAADNASARRTRRIPTWGWAFGTIVALVLVIVLGRVVFGQDDEEANVKDDVLPTAALAVLPVEKSTATRVMTMTPTKGMVPTSTPSCTITATPSRTSTPTSTPRPQPSDRLPPYRSGARFGLSSRAMPAIPVSAGSEPHAGVECRTLSDGQT